MTQPTPVANTSAGVSFDDTEIAFSAQSNADLRRMHMLFGIMNRRWLVGAGTAFVKAALALRLPLVKGIVKQTVFRHFCGGETIEACEPAIQRLWKYRVGTILDYSVEGADTEEGFEATTAEIIRTIDKAAGNPAIPFSVFKVTGLASTALLQKVQAGHLLAEAETAAYKRVKDRVERICRQAYVRKVRVFIDAEETWIQDAIDAIAYEMMEKYNRRQCIVYNTYQFYRWDMLDNLAAAYRLAEEKDFQLGAKLVRGAYMEKEARRAAEEDRPNPIQPNKPSTDRDFDDALKFCLHHRPRMAICVGTHNEESTYYILELMRMRGIQPDDPRVFFAQLYGMSDNLSYNLAHAGYNVAKYVPYGPVAAVMPYLFRRAAENTSVAGQTSREFNLIRKEMRRRQKQHAKTA